MRKDEPDDDHFRCQQCRKVFKCVTKDGEPNYEMDPDHNVVCLNCAGRK